MMEEAEPWARPPEADPGQGAACVPSVPVTRCIAYFLGFLAELATDAFMAVRGNSIVKHRISSGEGIPFMFLFDMPAFSYCVFHSSSFFAELLRCKKELFTCIPI
jgi:hypothetical protein